MQEDKDPYSNYDLDDWQWEFLRRNPRYIKAYRAVEWIKKRLEKKAASGSGQNTSFVVFGTSYWFTAAYFSGGRVVWKYNEWTGNEGEMAQGWYLDLPSPEAASQEYKEKILRMRKPRAVVTWGEWSDEDETYYEIHPPYAERKLNLVIDTRYDIQKIVAELKKILKDKKLKQRQRFELYPDYLKVWDLREEGLTDSQIAQKLWPDDYAADGGRDSGTGDKGALIQRVYDYESAAQRLIDNSFPLKKR